MNASASLARRVTAGTAGLLGVLPLFLRIAGSDRGQVLLPVLALAGAALLVQYRGLGPQLLARAAFWANLALGAALCGLGGQHERPSGAWLALGCSVALLVLGQRGLAEAGERAGYSPIAFRGSLLVLMVLALADTQSYVLFGIIDGTSAGVMLIAAAVALVVGFVGLYAMQAWGVIVNLVTSVIVLALSGLRVVRFGNGEVRKIVCILAMLQVLAVTPMLYAMITGRALPSLPRPLRARMTSVVIGCILVVSLALATR